MLVTPIPMIQEQQCVVPLGNDRIEKILTISQCKSLKERWTINLKIDNMDEDLANRSRLPKKRLFKSFHLEEEDQPNDGSNRQFDEINHSNCSSLENNNSLLTNEPQTTYHSSSRPNHNFAHSAAQQQTAPVNLETVKNATAPSVVTNFAASNTSSSTTVAVVKPTFSAPSPTADNLKIESPATANTTTTTANITNEKAERGISASEVTERSGRNSSPKSLQHHASTTSLNQNNAKHFEDGGSPRLTMLNGKYYERKNEEIDKVVIHKKRRRLSESPNERKSTPPVGINEAKVTVSKRVSTESNASSGEPRSGQSSGSNSPKNYSQIKRKKREPEDIINQREVVGTVTRICQELPRCNWLEEKILKTSAAVNSINCTTSNKDSIEKSSSVATSSSSISSSPISRSNTNIPPPITPVAHYTNDISSASHPMIAHSQVYANYIHQQGIGSPNVSRVLPVKKPHLSPILFESEPTKAVESGHQMPELIADQHAIKNSSVHNAMTTTSRVEFLSDKEKRLSHETVTSPYAPSKPPSRSEIVGENLNGSNSGLANNYVDNGPRSPNYKYEYMSKNLSMRLNQMNSMGTVVPESTRHDLFELDRKRKHLLDEVECIQKKKMEELENIKRIEAKKEALMKELANTQDVIEKQKLFMKQLEKDIMGKSRGQVPQQVHPQQPAIPSNPQHARPQQHAQQVGHPHLLRHEFNPQHAAAAAAAAAAGGVYPPSGHFPPHPAPHHLHRPGYHPPPAQGYPELVRHHQHHSANRPHALMEAGSASLPPRSSQPYQPHVPPAQAFGAYNSQPPQLQRHPRIVDQNIGKFGSSAAAGAIPSAYAGQVSTASRHPSQQNYSAAITRQANAGWMANQEYHRARMASGDKSPNPLMIASSTNGTWKPAEAAPTSNIPKDPLKGLAAATSCKNCRKEANFMCSACKSVHYCSLDCQKMHWLEHSKHCISKSQQQKPVQSS